MQYHDLFFSGLEVNIVIELVEDGNLDAIIKNAKIINNIIPEKDILYIFTQILLALNYIHKKVLHRD